MTPSQIYAWEGLGADVDLTPYSEARMPSEEKWYALTGRIDERFLDGDLRVRFLEMASTPALNKCPPNFDFR